MYWLLNYKFLFIELLLYIKAISCTGWLLVKIVLSLDWQCGSLIITTEICWTDEMHILSVFNFPWFSGLASGMPAQLPKATHRDSVTLLNHKDCAHLLCSFRDYNAKEKTHSQSRAIKAWHQNLFISQ